jgi:hypothetical protein
VRHEDISSYHSLRIMYIMLNSGYCGVVVASHVGTTDS